MNRTVVTADGGVHGADAGVDAFVVASLLELGLDHLVDDAPGKRVGQVALQAASDLDAKLAFGLGHHQEGTVVLLGAPDLPGASYLEGEALDRLSSQLGYGEQGDLVGRPRAVRLHQGLEPLFLLLREQAGQVGDPTVVGRNGVLP